MKRIISFILTLLILSMLSFTSFAAAVDIATGAGVNVELFEKLDGTIVASIYAVGNMTFTGLTIPIVYPDSKVDPWNTNSIPPAVTAVFSECTVFDVSGYFPVADWSINNAFASGTMNAVAVKYINYEFTRKSTASRTINNAGTKELIATTTFKIKAGSTVSASDFYWFVKTGMGAKYGNIVNGTSNTPQNGTENQAASFRITYDKEPPAEADIAIDAATNVSNTTATVIGTTSGVTNEDCGIILKGTEAATSSIDIKFLAYDGNASTLFKKNGKFAVVLTNIKTSKLPAGNYTVTPFIGSKESFTAYPVVVGSN